MDFFSRLVLLLLYSGVQYVGLCCGNVPHFLRKVTAVYEKPAPALNYFPEIEQHFVFRDKKKITQNELMITYLNYRV